MSHTLTYQLKVNADGTVRNGQPVKEAPALDDLHSGLTAWYRWMALDYPKFHKMDHLSKLAFLGVELLTRETSLARYGDDGLAMVFQNSYSSLDTDQKHQTKIHEGQASPAVFVYTLPNILMGEIAIRHRWYGENLFVLTDQFDFEKWKTSALTLLEAGKAKAVLGGWVEVFDDYFDLRLYLLETASIE